MKKNTWVFDCFWLLLFLCLLFGWMLGTRALSVPDEGRYCEIPREMLWFHDFITPHLDGIKYFEKPPLLYWMQAGIMSCFGINEWTLRLPTALMAVFGCLSVYGAGRFLFNRCVGILAALLLATSPLYFAMAHSITPDMTVTVWMTVTLLSFLVVVNSPEDNFCRHILCAVMFASAGFAVLSKGLIGMVLPGMVVFTWLLIFNRWRDLKTLHWFSGLTIFLLISLPWHILVQIKNPEFFHFYFVDQHFLRYLTNDMDRYQPMWWFVPVLLGGLFPWIIFLFSAIRQVVPLSWSGLAEYKNQIFFLIGVVEIFLFFSFSHSKLIPYILPVFPLLALLIADYLVKAIDDLSASRQARQSSILLKLFAGIPFLLAIMLAVLPWLPISLTPVQSFSLQLMAIPLALMGIGIFLLKWPMMKLKWALLMQIVFLWCFVAFAPHFDSRPIKPLALFAKHLAKPGDLIVNYGEYHQDLPVYTEHFVLIVNWLNELAFGVAHQPSAQSRLLNSAQFWSLWKKPQRVLAIMSEEDYQAEQKHHHMFLLMQENNNVLVSNQS